MKYPPELLDFVREFAPGRSNPDLLRLCQERFGEDIITLEKLVAFKKNRKISSGLTGWYDRGHVPDNKGKRWDEFFSKEAQRRSRATCYSKGHRPHNELPVGAVIVNGEGYLLKKVQETGIQRVRWQFLHRLVWEEEHGPVPKGYAVVFADRDKMNCSLDNLVLISNRQRAVITKLGLHYWDRESLETAMKIAELKSKTCERKKG